MFGVSVSLSEAHTYCRSLQEGLQVFGHHGVQLIISDDHAGLRKARQAMFTGVCCQQYQFHLQQNVCQYAPRKNILAEVTAYIRGNF